MDLQPTTLVDMIYDSSVQTSMSCFFGGVSFAFLLSGHKKECEASCVRCGKCYLVGFLGDGEVLGNSKRMTARR